MSSSPSACGDPAIGAQITRTYDAAPVHNHSPADVASLLHRPGPDQTRDRGRPRVETRMVHPGPVHATRRASPGRDRPQTRPRRRGGPVMTGEPGVTLESLDFEWGDAYLICYARDQWAALRRDTHRFLAAPPWTSWPPGSTPTTRHPRCRATLTRPAQRTTSPPRTRTKTRTRPRAGTGEAGAAGRAAGGVPAVGHQLRAVFPGLDRPQRRRHHLPEHGRAAVFRSHADRAEGTPGPARPRLGLAALARHGPLIDPRPAPRVAAPRAPLYAGITRPWRWYRGAAPAGRARR